MRFWRVGFVTFVALAALLAACVPPAPEPEPPRILTAELPVGTGGLTYLAFLDADGGAEPYKWSATGLPEGVDVSADGAVEGVPGGEVDDFTVTVSVTDAAGSTAQRDLVLPITAAVPAECHGQPCAEVHPAPGAAQIPASAVVAVERGAEGPLVAVTVTGAAPAVGQVVNFERGEYLPTGFVATVTATQPADGGATRLAVEAARPSDAFEDITLHAVGAEGPAVRTANVAASMFDCDADVALEAGSTTISSTLEPELYINQKRRFLGVVPWGGLKEFSASISGDVELRIDFGISGAASCTASPTLPQMTVPAGPLGAFLFRLTPSLELEVSGSARVTASVKLKCNVRYDWKEGTSNSTATCGSTHQPLQVNASNGVDATLEATLGAQATWNEIGGITGSIVGELHAGYGPDRNPKGQLDAKMGWDVGFCLLCFWDDTPYRGILAKNDELFKKVLATFGEVDPGYLPPPPVPGPVTTRVSVASDGTQGNRGSFYPEISADGRYAAFSSGASNLVPGDDAYGPYGVFVHNRLTGDTTRVSGASDGTEGNGDSESPALSADGRYVTFHSSSSDLVPGDTNNATDVFVHDRVTGATTLVSVASGGTQGNSGSFYPEISADGRYIAFSSWASNLVVGDTNDATDVFVHDRVTGATTLVSVASDGTQGNSGANAAEISADGRYVAFDSFSSNLVLGDTNDGTDVFVHDRVTGATTRVSVASDGTQGKDRSYGPALSADGRYVAFGSFASGLVPGDTNNAEDVFVHDRVTGATTLVSVASDGTQGNSISGYPEISADGRYVAFRSLASDLVPGDSNDLIDVFVHDRVTGATTLVSVASDGTQGNKASDNPALSADGRHVAFSSSASNLVADDTNGAHDVFVRDRGA